MTSERMYRTTVQVGPGHRIELVAPDLVEGEKVDVILLPSSKVEASKAHPILDLLLSSDRPVHDEAYWVERERELQESRDSWDR